MEANCTLQLLIEVIGKEYGRPVTLDTPLAHLGIDSLEFVELMQTVERQFKPIPKERWGSIDTVGDIAAALAS